MQVLVVIIVMIISLRLEIRLAFHANVLLDKLKNVVSFYHVLRIIRYQP